MASPGPLNLSVSPEGSPASVKKVRRRIGRACDQCNALRTKCDGKYPCARCSEADQTCEYNRLRKKRGKAPSKGNQKFATNSPNPQRTTDTRSGAQGHDNLGDPTPSGNLPMTHPDVAMVSTPGTLLSSMFNTNETEPGRNQSMAPFHQDIGSSTIHRESQIQLQSHERPEDNQAEQLRLQHYGRVNSMLGSQAFNGPENSIGHLAPSPQSTHRRSHSEGQRYGISNLLRRQSPENESFTPGARGSAAEGQTPNWLDALPAAHSPSRLSVPLVPSPRAGVYPISQNQELSDGLRYPVLRPALPYIASIIPVPLACELLELYFTSLTSAFVHPISPYITAHVFRKASFLRATKPRVCSPALLVSMLWIAAQTSDASFLTASITARGKVCQKLLETTLNLLKPLVHQPNNVDESSNTVINGVALGGFGVNVNLPLPSGRHSVGTMHLTAESSAEVDDIATYIHLATVISASEYKAASIRWWSVVWSLARELRFGRELPRPEMDDGGAPGVPSTRLSIDDNTPITEEAREERRRIWWLVYTVDRHLSLCYNQPLSLRDVDCVSLLRPVPEAHWQAGEEYYGPPAIDATRPRGPGLECTDHGIFGFFTPLMTICGECIELQQARCHPILGQAFRPQYEWDSTITLIRSHLKTYADSLASFQAQHLPEGLTATSSIGSGPCLTEHQVQTIVVLAYAEHLMHVMHILIEGKWDPINLLDDADMWISTDAFLTASNHAIEAAQALSPILEYDPDLSFMPWFFGIYLLQGSFLLLLFADKLGTSADERHVGACERCVRAIEACVVTLNTEYQRNFRKIMRSALAQVRGRTPNDFGEQQFKRRELLSHYRWTGDGGGLAL